MRRNILIDADPGIDDAIALAVAVKSQDNFNIMGITTVAGNQSLERVTTNALKLTSFLGVPEIPVASGMDSPLVRECVDAGHIHGSTGLGHCQLPETDKKIVSDNAVTFMAEKIMALPEGEKATLVPLGPLTNIAMLLKVFPEVKARIEEIVLMGGAAAGGNITPSAEFNIWEDPEAAKMVFTAGLPIVMCGLDVTNRCALNEDQMNVLKAQKHPIPAAYGEMLDFYYHSRERVSGKLVAIHDAVTFTYLLHPEWFETRKAYVEIDCSERLNRGMTVCEFRDGWGGEKQVDVVVDAKLDLVAQFWFDILLSYGIE